MNPNRERRNVVDDIARDEQKLEHSSDNGEVPCLHSVNLVLFGAHAYIVQIEKRNERHPFVAVTLALCDCEQTDRLEDINYQKAEPADEQAYPQPVCNSLVRVHAERYE